MPQLVDIAREAQISPRTVARILSGRNREVWPSAVARADRVREIAKRLGYRPNAAARATREGRFGSVALITSSVDLRTVLPSPLTDGIFESLTTHDLQLAIARLSDEQLADPDYVPKVLAQRACDGLLVHFPLGTPDRVTHMIGETGLPAVGLGQQGATDAVYADDLRAGIEATERLLKLGHRRIAYADYHHGTDVPQLPVGRDRRAGYERAMRGAGLPPRYLCDIEPWYSQWQPPSDFHGGRRLRYSVAWMSRDDCPTAVVSYGHETAIPIMLACERTGRRFPDRFSLMTFGEVLWQTSISCDGMVQPNSELGARAVRMLAQKIAEPDRPCPADVLNYWYRPGHTLGPPRQD
jgi:DNA-binding LacI/PurR family transcriptional regulator